MVLQVHTLVEFDWDVGFATANLLQDHSSTSRMDISVHDHNDDDDSEEVVECIVDTMLTMVHIEGTADGAAHEGQNERTGDGQEQSCVSSPSTEDATITKRWGAKKIAIWTDEDGSKRPCLPKQTFWYSHYVLHPDLGDPHYHKIFRLRFRLPYEQFVELNQRLES